MKKLKCESCGGNLKIDESKEYATCPFCETKYKLNEDLTIKVKLDDDMKEIIKGQAKVAKTVATVSIIPFIIVPIIVVTMIVVGVVVGIKQTSKSNVNRFNNIFLYGNGDQQTVFIINTIDKVIDSNKKNKRKITVRYGGIESQDEKEIMNIKHSLKKFQYNVTYEYDKKGYIEKIIITEM